MSGKRKTSGRKVVWIVSGILILGTLAGAVFFVKVLLSGDEPKRKVHPSVVQLLKPPPPPPPKEQPPEPEPEIKKAPEEVIETPQNMKQAAEVKDKTDDDKPAGKHLGVDAAGGAGSDGFGLLGKQGGSALIGGGGGGGGLGNSLLRKYGWYTQILQDEIGKKLRKQLDQNGGIPKKNLQVTVKITLDPRGRITDYKILTSSGDPKMDGALKETLTGITITQPPPDGMPKGMSIKISSQG